MVETNEVKALTAQEVIKSRQSEIFNELSLMDVREKELIADLEALRMRRDQRRMEYDILGRVEERGMVRVTTSTTTTVEATFERHRPADRLPFEDCLRLIMREAGRPVRVGELISELEKYSYRWNKYVSAHNYVTGCGLLESAGKRGYYQLIRRR